MMVRMACPKKNVLIKIGQLKLQKQVVEKKNSDRK